VLASPPGIYRVAWRRSAGPVGSRHPAWCFGTQPLRRWDHAVFDEGIEGSSAKWREAGAPALVAAWAMAEHLIDGDEALGGHHGSDRLCGLLRSRGFLGRVGGGLVH